MTPHGFTEDQLLERPALEVLKTLGWTVVSAAVKKVARQLLEKVKVAVVLDWRQKSQARARVRLTIEDTLDEGLPRAYTPELFEQKVAVSRLRFFLCPSLCSPCMLARPTSAI